MILYRLTVWMIYPHCPQFRSEGSKIVLKPLQGSWKWRTHSKFIHFGVFRQNKRGNDDSGSLGLKPEPGVSGILTCWTVDRWLVKLEPMKQPERVDYMLFHAVSAECTWIKHNRLQNQCSHRSESTTACGISSMKSEYPRPKNCSPAGSLRYTCVEVNPACIMDRWR